MKKLTMKRRKKSSSYIILIFFIPFLIWIALQVFAPIFIDTGTISNLSGTVGVSDNEKIIDKIPFPWSLAYSCGDRLCHQKADRSFFINENQMSFCSRCTAIWLGLAIGLGFMIFYTIDLNEKFLILIVAGIIPIGIDGVGQLLKLWDSTNMIRLITGLLTGIVCGLSIGIIIDEVREIRVFKKKQKLVNEEN